jgi:hypothetical protein
MSWNPTGETIQTIQEIKSELPKFDTVKTAICIGYTKGFPEILSSEFNIDAGIFNGDMKSTSFTTHIENGLVPKSNVLEHDLIYINGLTSRRVLGEVIMWATRTQAKYIFIDKTHDKIVNDRYYTYWYKHRATNQSLCCHLRYRNDENEKQMLTVLKRYDI